MNIYLVSSIIIVLRVSGEQPPATYDDRRQNASVEEAVAAPGPAELLRLVAPNHPQVCVWVVTQENDLELCILDSKWLKISKNLIIHFYWWPERPMERDWCFAPVLITLKLRSSEECLQFQTLRKKNAALKTAFSFENDTYNT